MRGNAPSGCAAAPSPGTERGGEPGHEDTLLVGEISGTAPRTTGGPGPHPAGLISNGANLARSTGNFSVSEGVFACGLWPAVVRMTVDEPDPPPCRTERRDGGAEPGGCRGWVGRPAIHDSTGVAPGEHPPVVEVAIPVFNEEQILEASTCRLRAYLDESFPFETTISIVDNASTDATWEIATRLARTLPGVSALRLDQKGKGRAIRAAWSSSSAQIVAYMDVDLSPTLAPSSGGAAPLGTQ